MCVMDWLGKAIGLPPAFLFCGGTNGGGVIQGTASEVRCPQWRCAGLTAAR